LFLTGFLAAVLSAQPAQISDSDLVRSIANGDESAVAALYDRYRAILFGVIFRILGSRGDAEDVLQEVFLQVWNKAADFDESRGRPFTWLVTLARSRAIDRLRSRSARDRVTDEATRELTYVDDGEADEDVIRAQQSAAVRGGLAQLPEEQRTVLLLAYYEGFSQSEIAERLGTPLGTVKTRMRTGLARLRTIFGARISELL
jgi:RNA polymerase sigma-70 factor, ECF subfamily